MTEAKPSADDPVLPNSAQGANPVHELHSLLSQSFDQIKHGRVDESSPAGACLYPLLMALGWSGEDRHLVEAMPHFDAVHHVDGLRAVLAALNYESYELHISTGELTSTKLPSIILADDDNVLIALKMDESGQLLVFDGERQALRLIEPDRRSRTMYLIREYQPAVDQSEIQKVGWIQLVLSRFKRTFTTVLCLSFAINLMAIMVPLYIMGIYQMAIAGKSVATLVSLLAGMCIVIAIEIGLRIIRSRAIAYLGARVESLVVLHTFRQLLYLPISQTGNSSVATQVTRLKQYQNVRGIFTGSLATSILDLPFILLFVGATFAIGGVLGFIPVALILIYAGMAATTIPIANKHLRQAGTAKNAIRNFLMETTSKHGTIRDLGAQQTWIKRYENLAGESLRRQFRAQQFNVTVQTIAQTLMVAAGAATVGIGTLLAMDGSVSLGALIGSTTLVWRGLSPIQSAFLGLSRLGQSVDSMKQVNQLMRMALERNPSTQATVYRKFKGKIALQGVSLRYTQHSDPSLIGVTMQIGVGETIAITGDSGAGKSTVLKVIANLYPPQAGAVLIDDLHTRQLNLGELRHAIGYVPQKPSFFYGTISQNLRLSHPTATDADIERSLRMAGILDTVNKLDGGVEFRLQGRRESRFSDGFMRQLMLARAFVKDASIYLLDEPGAQLDRSGDEALVDALKSLHGKSTIVMVTHRPSHMYLADRVIVMHRGQIAMEGPPEQIVPAILKPAQKSTAA